LNTNNNKKSGSFFIKRLQLGKQTLIDIDVSLSSFTGKWTPFMDLLEREIWLIYSSVLKMVFQ
jgi:hypothetical protein